jgi:hypothetical protein
MINNYEMITTSSSEHEKIFDDICNKMNDLNTTSHEEETQATQPKYEQMQVQMRKFHNELKDSQDELREKIKTLGNVSYGSETIHVQTQQLADQLGAERVNNAKMSADLAKSLELSLQLQLEIQSIKSRALQIQSEEKKYSQSLVEKNNLLQRDLELSNALKDETSLEFLKAKNASIQEHTLWNERQGHFENQIKTLKNNQMECEQHIQTLDELIIKKDETIALLHQELENISKSFSEVELSAQQQSEVLKNLMDVAETKIIEVKVALDKKTLESQDYYSHLQQALNQAGILRQENTALKEYVTKLNYFYQQSQLAQNQMAASQPSPVAQNQSPSPELANIPSAPTCLNSKRK